MAGNINASEQNNSSKGREMTQKKQLDEICIAYIDYETQRRVMLEYLQVMAARGDWHGVADAAMDLREMEAERKHAVPAMPE
jgi:hypothetical protein